MRLFMIFIFGTILHYTKGQTTQMPSDTCSRDSIRMKFALSSSSHSAWEPSSSCYLSLCNMTVGSSNTSCRSSNAPCFKYQTINNISYCAPGTLCSALVPCDNVTGGCPSSASVCVINSCCTPRAVCLPLPLIGLCSLNISSLYSTVSTVTAATSSSSVTNTNTTVSITNTQYRWNSTGKTVAGIGVIAGTAPNLLTYPRGIILDSSNTLYIADSGSNRVQRWLLDASSGSTVAGQTNGAQGQGLSYLNTADDVAVDANGHVYVVDMYNHRVVRWNLNASNGTLVAGTGSSGTGNNELYQPRGIALDINSNTLYIADYFNHRVMRYLSGALSGVVVAGGNGQGSASNQLNYPIGIHFHLSSNSLYIANSVGHNIVRWVIGASSWTLVAGSGSGIAGSTSTLLNQPNDVTVDSMGNVYVADTYNNRLQFFLAGQTTGLTIAGIGSASTAANGLNVPVSVAVDAQLNLYVSDYQNCRVQKFQRY